MLILFSTKYEVLWYFFTLFIIDHIFLCNVTVSYCFYSCTASVPHASTRTLSIPRAAHGNTAMGAQSMLLDGSALREVERLLRKRLREARILNPFCCGFRAVLVVFVLESMLYFFGSLWSCGLLFITL